MHIQVGLFIYAFGVLRLLQHYTGHITTESWKGRGNQYIQLVKVLYCKLPTNGKQLPAFPLEVGPETEPRPERCETRVLPLCHRGPLSYSSWIRRCNKMSIRCLRGLHQDLRPVDRTMYSFLATSLKPYIDLS